MRLRTNIAANYANVLYGALIGIAFMPLFYISMGSEAFGLIGFYSILQTWFVLMDFGLSASISRECARYKGGAISGHTLKALISFVERVFAGVAAAGVVAIYVGATWISTQWLELNNVSPKDAALSIQLMGVIIALRWMSGLYRGVLNGFERQLWTSNFGIVTATVRFPVAYLVVINLDFSIIGYFVFQLVVSVMELGVLLFRARDEIPVEKRSRVSFNDGAFRALVKFSLSMSFLGIVNTLIIHTDKLVLSKVLDLQDYGDFSLIMVLAGGILLLGGPIASAIIPRMSKLHAEVEMICLYRIYSKSVLITGAVVFSAGSFIAAMSNQILYAWTGSSQLAQKMELTLSFYAIANGIYVVSSFPHYLQYAYGNMKIQAYCSVFLALVLVPAVIWGALTYQTIGVSIAWLILSVLWFAVITTVVHRKYLPTNNAIWLRHYVLPTFVASLASSILLRMTLDWSSDRPTLALQLAACAFVVLASSLIATPRIRRMTSRVNWMKHLRVSG